MDGVGGDEIDVFHKRQARLGVMDCPAHQDVLSRIAGELGRILEVELDPLPAADTALGGRFKDEGMHPLRRLVKGLQEQLRPVLLLGVLVHCLDPLRVQVTDLRQDAGRLGLVTKRLVALDELLLCVRPGVDLGEEGLLAGHRGGVAVGIPAHQVPEEGQAFGLGHFHPLVQVAEVDVQAALSYGESQVGRVEPRLRRPQVVVLERLHLLFGRQGIDACAHGNSCLIHGQQAKRQHLDLHRQLGRIIAAVNRHFAPVRARLALPILGSDRQPEPVGPPGGDVHRKRGPQTQRHAPGPPPAAEECVFDRFQFGVTFQFSRRPRQRRQPAGDVLQIAAVGVYSKTR